MQLQYRKTKIKTKLTFMFCSDSNTGNYVNWIEVHSSLSSPHCLYLSCSEHLRAFSFPRWKEYMWHSVVFSRDCTIPILLTWFWLAYPTNVCPKPQVSLFPAQLISMATFVLPWKIIKQKSLRMMGTSTTVQEPLFYIMYWNLFTNAILLFAVFWFLVL